MGSAGKYGSIKILIYGLTIQLESLTQMIEELEEKEAEAKAPKCEHQVKENLTVMGGPDHWICKLCGYEYIEPTDCTITEE